MEDDEEEGIVESQSLETCVVAPASNFELVPQLTPEAVPESPILVPVKNEPKFTRRYTKEDLKYNFIAIRWICWFKMSCFAVDQKRDGAGDFPRFIPHHKTVWGRRWFLLWKIFVWCRLTLLTGTTAHFILTQDTSQEFHRMLVMLAGSSMLCPQVYGATIIIPRYSSEFCAVVNAILQYLDLEENESTPDVNKLESWRKLLNLVFKSLRELIIIYFPFLLLPLIGIVPVLIIGDPKLPCLMGPLLLGHIPDSDFRWYHQLAFGILVVFDTIMSSFSNATIFIVVFVFLAMHRLQEETQMMIKQLQGNWDGHFEEIEEALKGLRLMHLWTQYFNISLSTLVYAVKLIALSATIFGGFGVIELMDRDAAYAAVFGLCFVEGLVIYNLCFGKAYKIPETVEDLKQEIWSKGTEMGVPAVAKYVEKSLRAVPWLGVRDGVYKMDRLTCPTFTDFALKEVTSLVLSY